MTCISSFSCYNIDMKQQNKIDIIEYQQNSQEKQKEQNNNYNCYTQHNYSFEMPNNNYSADNYYKTLNGTDTYYKTLSGIVK